MVMPQIRRQPALMASSAGGGGGDTPAVPSSGAGVGTAGTGTSKVTRSQSYGTKLLRNLTELKTNDELCDFTVCAGGKLIQVKIAASLSHRFPP